MESAPYFESADALEVLAFEEKVDLRMRWPLPFPRCSEQGFLRLWSRCKVRESCRCKDRGKVYVRLDTLMS